METLIKRENDNFKRERLNLKYKRDQTREIKKHFARKKKKFVK